MRPAKWIVLRVVLILTLGSLARAQEPAAKEPPPKEAFKAVHLVTLTPADESSLLAALVEVNAVNAKAGHPEIRYRLYKVSGKQAGSHNYMWESSWPSGAVYEQIHGSAAFEAAIKKHPEVDALMKNETYNRYVEVTKATP
jgi:hypothetical protein